MQPQYKVSARIAKPVSDVFDAVVNPAKLSAYFTTVGGTTGPLETGKIVRWWDAVDINVVAVQPHDYVHLQWPPSKEHSGAIDIEMRFDALDDGATLVTISESGYADDFAALKATYSTCSGWTNMLACLKAWIEHGINLRDGNFLSELNGKPTFEESHDYFDRVRAEQKA